MIQNTQKAATAVIRNGGYGGVTVVREGRETGGGWRSVILTSSGSLKSASGPYVIPVRCNFQQAVSSN